MKKKLTKFFEKNLKIFLIIGLLRLFFGKKSLRILSTYVKWGSQIFPTSYL